MGLSGGPDPGQIEVTLFGPGYGECVCVHLGSGRWAVIDSCIDVQTKIPVALTYLREIGVDPAEQVDLLVGTHWHDDHTRGLAECFSSFSSARFCIASVLTNPEFTKYVKRYQEQPTAIAGSRVSEIERIFDLVAGTPTARPTARRASQGKVLYQKGAEALAHGQSCTITSLSPSRRRRSRFS
jgi:glyoxylase-like metal-dependent hydrolase (beta-lactamase superfamily II)